MTQCWAVLRAEDVYTRLLRDDPSKVAPGRRGTLEWTLDDGSRSASVAIGFELRANAVWRFGRVFLTCPRCRGLATRIYVPTSDAWAACRRWWALTYESRRENYKSSSRRDALWASGTRPGLETVAKQLETGSPSKMRDEMGII